MSAGELSDYSVCVVVHVRGQTAYVLDVLRERLEYPALKRKALGQEIEAVEKTGILSRSGVASSGGVAYDL
jgi:hypothetical protein